MSAVVCVATPKTVYIMSDGLVLSEERKKVRGDFRKFEMLNQTLCIGFTGTREFAQNAVDNLKSLCPDLEFCTAETAASYLVEISKELYKQCPMEAQFVVVGKSECGSIRMFTIKENKIAEELIPTIEEFRTAVLHPENNAIPKFTLYIYEQVKKGAMPQSELFRRAMNSFIVDASKVEKSINTNVFFHQFHLTE